MKTEVLSERPIVSTLRIDEGAASHHSNLKSDLGARSQLVWGEHCTECDYPACYTTCSLYTPRTDLNCRRFEAGFEPLAQDPEFKRVRFRQWGKVEAKGPARAFSAELSEAGALDTAWGYILKAPLAPARLKRKVAHLRQVSVVDQSSARRIDDFDAFVLEAFSADEREHVLTLTIKNVSETRGELFQTHITVTPQYGRHVIPLSDITAFVDLDAPHLIQIEPMGDAAGRDIIFALCDFVKWKAAPLATLVERRPSAGEGTRPAKVLVWDLDNTLWRGSLVEDGVQGLTLISEAVRAIRALDERGVIHSIASKNDHEAAVAALRHFGLLDYFLAPQISWRPKSEAVGDIAALLNLGLDSFVFIDDEAFERAEVVSSHPAVRALDNREVARLLELECFNLPVTDDARARRRMYIQDQTRSTALERSGEGYLDFLRTSDIVLTVDALSERSATRAYELSQRTNQLNFMGAKYSEADMLGIAKGWAGPATLTLHCKDKYGEYGLIGLALVDWSKGRVEHFFMSCRVQKKRVEHAFFAWLRSECLARGLSSLEVNHRPTERNGASRAMLEDLGFSQIGADLWARSLDEPFPDADVVQIVDLISRQDAAGSAAVSGGPR